MYGKLVYQVGRRYTQELLNNPDIEFPYFSGQISDILPVNLIEELSKLEGEFMIAYSNATGIKHMIRLTLNKGSYEADGGIPSDSDGFSMSTFT